MSIGKIIAELRKERGISQKHLAEMIGISQAAIAKIELERNEATSATIRKIATFFDVSADYLLGLEDDFGARTSPNAAPMGDSMTADERELIADFRRLSPYLQGIAKNTVRGLTGAGARDLHKKA